MGPTYLYCKIGYNLKITSTIIATAIFASVAKSQAVEHSVKLIFKNVVNHEAVQPEKVYYNTFGEAYTINLFKYYISNINLQNTNGVCYKSNETHLVNQADSSTYTIILKSAPNKFSAISFLIGVDSIYNVSGTQTGDLDPLNGMFWTWNSGYIMAKLEANSPVSKANNNSASYHIGGFRPGQQTSRKITLQLGNILAGNPREIVIEADINKWFSGVHALKIADNPVCTTPGSLAVMYADNYAEMFTIAAVK